MPHFWRNESHNDCDRMSLVATALNVYIGYTHETLAANRPSHTSVAIGRDVNLRKEKRGITRIGPGSSARG